MRLCHGFTGNLTIGDQMKAIDLVPHQTMKLKFKLPVELSDTRVTLNNGRIRKVKVEIAKMAAEKGCYYIDLYSALANDEKSLPTAIAQEDGIHMNQRGCQIWIDYLLNHAADEDNDQ